MEYRRDSLNMVKVCRFCLAQNNSLENLYDRDRPGKNSVNLHLKILSCVSIEIFPSDKMPTFICGRCKFFMNLFYEYKQIVRQADETILQYVQHNSPMEIVTWPTSLSNLFLTSNDVKIVETVEGGATVQVSSQDNFDSDEEDGNVYNIKIGDGPHDETKTACVKVITSKDGKEMKQVIEDPNIQDKEPADIISEKSLDERWACNECDCTYPLQQLLELHKSQKHRERTEKCELCEAKFFTRYDLNAHRARHSDEMPFQCAVCDKKFKRLIMLKRHEKMIHSDLPQQVCLNCPASFLTIEDLEEHKKKHIRIHRPYVCNICDKKFHEKNTLQRHILVVHNKAATYCCEYCPERFVSVTKLTRHVRTHAGSRSYPCKFCDKSFTKSHHYTRHLRQKHRETNRSAFGESEYRCEQCSDTFATQDEHIYHSAIHATQNLTCPLCQEKFPDVDAVTAHIKSHANGEAFMCDYCELVFTTKDKLEIHQLNVHDEEMRSEMCQDDSSVEMENEEDEDDNSINVKQDGEHMIIEIKKPNEFMINNAKEETDDKPDVTNSEESGSEAFYSDVTKVATSSKDLLSAVVKKNPVKILEDKPLIIKPVFKQEPTKPESKFNDKPTNILQKVEEMKRKTTEQTDYSVIDKKKISEEKPVIKIEGTNTGGASDKSLRLLEKELQDLKSTNSRSEMTKTPIKTNDIFRNKRLQLHTSTPKLKVVEDKKLPAIKSTAPEKKFEKRIVSKENKEVKETITKNNNGSNKEEKEIPKQSVIKNGSNVEKSNADDSIRRSTRPSKIKNYAKMIRDRSLMKDGEDDEEDEDDSTSEDDEEYRETSTSMEVRPKARRVSQTKPSPAPKPTTSTPAAAPRKRGRPRKFPISEVPAKIKKENEETEEKGDTAAQETIKREGMDSETPVVETVSKIPAEQKDTSANVLVSPTGHTLKKVPIRALPPGVKPLPLPVNARPMTGEVCEMQIGKKVVKVQKIVMTKAEVEAMAKKGLVEMKDGTMVLKQGIKLPTVESSLRLNPVSEETEKDTIKKEKAIPTRCDLDEES